ncbi:MAG: folP [Frankiales bacterium]|nr:folP [Frankiales bacterium]
MSTPSIEPAPVHVAAIVNRTRDSFFDRGATFALDRALAAIEKATAEGATWIDIGGVPFGPGEPVTIAEEIDRVVPLVAAARASSDLIISVDTTNAAAAAAAMEAGADVVNDTSAFSDPDMAAAIAAAGKGVVLVHSTSPPRVPVGRAVYGDVMAEVHEFLKQRAEQAAAAGIVASRTYLDPGHDLNKNTLHSLEITRRLEELSDLGYPLFVAVSNKDFIGETLGLPVTERLSGTVAAVAICVLKGARVVRVHNVAAAVQAVRLVEAIMGSWQPTGLRHNMGETGTELATATGTESQIRT